LFDKLLGSDFSGELGHEPCRAAVETGTARNRFVPDAARREETRRDLFDG
jgi:hypothetical protein